MSDHQVAFIRVRRNGTGGAPEYQSWEVPWQEGMTVLDGLIWIRQRRDPSLAVRYSCVSCNACKECSAVINGKVGYLCMSRLGSEPVTCDPLPKRRLVRDLVVDLTAAGE